MMMMMMMSSRSFYLMCIWTIFRASSHYQKWISDIALSVGQRGQYHSEYELVGWYLNETNIKVSLWRLMDRGLWEKFLYLHLAKAVLVHERNSPSWKQSVCDMWCDKFHTLTWNEICHMMSHVKVWTWNVEAFAVTLLSAIPSQIKQCDVSHF